jgi:hypothetical protein
MDILLRCFIALKPASFWELSTTRDHIGGRLPRWNDEEVIHGVDVRPKSPRFRLNDSHDLLAELGRWDLPGYFDRDLRFAPAGNASPWIDS